MFALDLFNNDHERRLAEGAVDQLEQRRIDDLAMKMDDLVARAKNPAYKKNPAALAALMKEFQKCKAERDSYYKIRNETMGYGSLGEGQMKQEMHKAAERMTLTQFINRYGDEEWIREFWNNVNGPMDEGGIPGNVPAEKIPGKEDLLKGKGRSYYEDQKKNSETGPLDQKLQRLKVQARRQFPRAQTDDEALILKLLDKETQDDQANRRTNARQDDELRKNFVLDREQDDDIDNLQTQVSVKEHGGGIGPKQHWQDLMQERKLSPGDPVVVTAPNEFEGKTGEIYDFSPSGTFVIVDLYNHGKHSMHLSDVAYNQYADDQEQDDWYDDEDTLEEANVNPQFIIAQVTKILAGEARRMTNAPMAQLLAPVMREYSLTLQQIDSMVPGGLKKAAGEYGIMMKEGWSDAMVAKRTGTPRTPYSVYIKGKKWKDFENDDHAEAVANKLRAKFKAEGRDPSVITIAPTDMSEAISKKDLLGRLQKDLPKVNDPKNKDAEPVKWTGPGKDDYGYTGYQGHGMPTDKAERARIRADKKKGVAEATGDSKFDAMMGKISKDPWTQLNSDPNWEYEIEELVDQHIEPWLLAMEKSGMPITRDNETLNPGWRKRYEQISTQLAQKYLASKKFNPRDPDLVGKIRAAIDNHTDQSRNVHGQLSAYANDLPMQRYADAFDADGMTANIRDAMAGLAPRDDDDDGYAPRPAANPRKLDPGNMEEAKADPSGSWVVYNGNKVKRFKSHDGAKAYAEKAGGKVASSEHYADRIQKQSVGEAIVASGPSRPLDDRAVRKMVWDTMKINADTGEQALQRALAVLAKKPQSRMVQDLQDKFQSLADRLAQGVTETALNPKDPQGDYAAKRKALQDLGMNNAVDQAAVLQRRLDLDREAKAKGITEGAMGSLHADLADVYRRMAPGIERNRDSFKAGQLYDALEAVAEQHGAEAEFKRMMNGARNRAHMDYDTNPGGFHNWFWYLPFAEDDVTEGWKQNVAAGILGATMALGAAPVRADTGINVNPVQVQQMQQQSSLTQKYVDALVQRAKDDGKPIDTRTMNSIKAKASDMAAKQIQKQSGAQQQTQQSNFPSQGSERMTSPNYNKFEDEMSESLMKEPTNRKEYLDQRDKLFRMMAVDSNPANKQIIKQALQDLEARYGNLKNAVKEESSTDSEAVERAILNRIMVAHTDLLMKFGPDKVMQAAEEVAYNVGDLDEIGTSDVSAYVHQVKQILGVPEEVNEKWSQKYKSSINCANPKGFSQKAHCAGRKKGAPN